MTHPPRALEVGPNMRLAGTGATFVAVIVFAFQVGQWKLSQDLLHERVTKLEQERTQLTDTLAALKQEVISLRTVLNRLDQPPPPQTTYARGSK